MAIDNSLINKFVDVTNDSNVEKKESNLYGTVKIIEGKTFVQIDGSEILTPMPTAVTSKEGDRVKVEIKDHSAVIVGNMTDPSAMSSTVDGLNLTVESVSANVGRFLELLADKATIGQLEAAKAEITELLVGKVTAEELEAELAKIDELIAKKVSTETFNAELANIDTLIADKAGIEDLAAANANIANLSADMITVNNLIADKASIGDLDVVKASVNELNAGKASVGEINALKANIADLDATVGEIDTLIFGSASGSTIQTSFANAVIAQLGNAQIKSAMIENISASKIKAGDILTNNVRVMSEDGSLIISDETLQISDETRVRVQIGKDASNDYSINIWDASGNLMFSKGGITDAAIKDAIIRNDMVAANANISASKLDIDSLFEEINGSSKTIKSTKVYLDEKGQTLDVAFTKITSDVEGVQGTVTTHGTDITALNGAITGKIWQQDINTTIDKLEIGGRNYVLNSEVERSGVYSGVINYKLNKEKVAELAGRDLVLSAYVKNTDNAKFDMYIRDSSSNTIRPSGFGIPHQTTSEYTRFVNKFTLSSLSNLTADTWYVGIRSNTNVDPANTGTTSVKMVKLEVGTNVTDWTPAPEDVEDEITTLSDKYTEVKSTADGLVATVAGHTAEIANKADGSTVTYVSDRVATLEGSLDGFKTTVSSTYTTKSEFNNLQIGGRNLLPNSDKMYAFSCAAGLSASRPNDEYFQVISSSGNGNWINMYFGRSTNVENEFADGDPFTISFTMRSPSSEDDTLPTVYLKSGMGYYQLKGKLTADWSTVWYSGIWKDANSISFHLGFSKCIGTYEFLNCKLEKGTKATDWTPAPEDVNAAIELRATKTEVEQLPDRIMSTVSETYTTKAEFDNLEIGGRNLALSTKNVKTASGNGAAIYELSEYGINAVQTIGREVIVSFDAYSTGTTAIDFYLRGNNQIKSDTNNDSAVDTTLKHYSGVLKPTSTGVTQVAVRSNSNVVGYVSGYTVYISNLKLELGNKATDWTPAPEDVETRIVSAESSFTQRADSIEGRVGDVEGRVSIVEQTAEGLTVSLQDLEIGGRNLLKNSTFAKNADQWTYNASNPFVYLSNGGYRGDGALQITVTASNIICPRQTIIRTFAAGSVLTCSVKVKEVEGTWNTSAYGRFANLYSLPYLYHRQLENGWTLYVYQSKLTSDLTIASANMFGFGNLNKGTYIIDDMKLELGTKATDWTPAPEDVDTDVANAAKTATNYMSFSNNGLVVGDMTASKLGNNVLIDSDSVDIRNGTTVLASYKADSVELGKNSRNAVIDLCAGTAQIKNINDDPSYEWNRLGIVSGEGGGGSVEITANQFSAGTYFENVTNDWGTTHIFASSYSPWASGHNNTHAIISMYTDRRTPIGSRSTNMMDMYDGLIRMISSHKEFESDNTQQAALTIGKQDDYGHAGWYGVGISTVNIAGNFNYAFFANEAASYIGIPSSGVMYVPYYQSGDALDYGSLPTKTFYTSGFVTNAGKDVYFTIPLAKPAIGISTVSADSIDGFQLRQNNSDSNKSYTHGSSAGAWAEPYEYEAYLANDGNSVTIIAKFTTTTNVINNAPIGIRWSGYIEFDIDV